MNPEIDEKEMPEGLRERKKRRTRETIAATALQLFAEHGFQGTTIAHIAAAAEVAPRTVSSYFPVKEELAFPDHVEAIESLRLALRDRAAGDSALEILRTWLDDAVAKWLEKPEEMALRRRVIESDPALRAYELRVIDEMRDILGEEIARDLGAEAQDLEPRLAATATVAVFEELGAHFNVDSSGTVTDIEETRVRINRVFDQALRFVEAGIKALQEEGRQRS